MARSMLTGYQLQLLLAGSILLLASYSSCDPVFSTGGNITVEIINGSALYLDSLYLYNLTSKQILLGFGNNRMKNVITHLYNVTAGEELVLGIYVQDRELTWFAGEESRNADGMQHAVVYSSQPGGGEIVLGFEDLPKDEPEPLYIEVDGTEVFDIGPDFNDLIVRVSGAVTAVSPNPPVTTPNTTVPQPNTTFPQPNTTFPQPNNTIPMPNTTFPMPNNTNPRPNNTLPGIPPPDTTKPVLTVPRDMEVFTRANQVRIFYNAYAYDAVDGTLTPTCTPPSGIKAPIGATWFTCTAKDKAGNKVVKKFKVQVKRMSKVNINPVLPTLAPIGRRMLR